MRPVRELLNLYLQGEKLRGGGEDAMEMGDVSRTPPVER
jgi:hypothetical protein